MRRSRSRSRRTGRGISARRGVASAALGRHIWTSFSSAALETTLEILDGKDPTTYPRYLSYLVKNPLYQDWIKSANDRDSTLGEKQRAWSTKRK
jgi:hypothetical protein